MKKMYVNTTTLVSSGAIWLPLFKDADSVAIHFHTPPESWTEFSRLRGMSQEHFTRPNGQSGTLLNMKEFLRRMVEASAPDAWRGFVNEDDEEIPFSRDALLLVLYNNELAATAFLAVLGAHANAQQQRRAAALGNSGAGHGTPSTMPGSPTTPPDSV